MKKNVVVLLFYLSCSYCFGQSNDQIFSRLQAISNKGTNFYNVDGIEITSTIINQGISKKNILKGAKKYGIKEEDLGVSDSLILQPNYYVSKSEPGPYGITQMTSYYFVENSNKMLMTITFASLNKKDRVFERSFVQLLLNRSIPDSVYQSLQIDSINFAGRKIALGNQCYWMGVGNTQCPGHGQMSWSVHKDELEAREDVLNRYKVIKAKKNGRVLSEETVNVVFEGIEVRAKKIIYDFKGLTSALVRMSGGQTLTVYFVNAPVRNQYVSCVMSFWNNDKVNPETGLPGLLSQVMKLKSEIN
ncbi:hypothetical protein [Pedobacter nutrimenti]|uniref:hypothetical protein n=1 Tax=Pedobacter nutrimenti TaxID=1241337 RepID=UPI00292F9E7C|nr:hypothetical protein [Pedobacter nutrimenti]